MSSDNPSGGRAGLPLSQGAGGLTSRPSPKLAALHLPVQASRRAFTIPDTHRDRGIHFVAGSGSGKSLTLGKLIAFLDFMRGVPQVLFDPHGPMIDAFLLQLTRFSKPVRQRLWPLVRYVDMAAVSESVVAFPLLYELPGDSRKDIADRFLETCRAIDPHLQSASIQGYNALTRIGVPVGIILSSVGLQLDAAADLLANPEHWRDRLAEAEARFPESRPAAEFFRREYLKMSAGERSALTATYLGKIAPFTYDASMRAMFCTTPAGIDWRAVVDNRQAVLLDFRGETNLSRRAFKTRWVYDTLIAFIRHRGAGRHRPLAIHIDEITELTNQESLGQELFARDLDYLFNVLMRNYGVWVTAAHQQMFQVSPPTQKTLLTLGTQLFGVAADLESATHLAFSYGDISPYRVKRFDKVWGGVPLMRADGPPVSYPQVLDQRAVDLPLDEQAFLAARVLMNLKSFEYLACPRDERRLRKISAREWVAEGGWPSDQADTLAFVRAQLAARAGRSLALPAPDPGARILLPSTPVPPDILLTGDDGDDPDDDDLFFDSKPA